MTFFQILGVKNIFRCFLITSAIVNQVFFNLSFHTQVFRIFFLGHNFVIESYFTIRKISMLYAEKEKSFHFSHNTKMDLL